MLCVVDTYPVMQIINKRGSLQFTLPTLSAASVRWVIVSVCVARCRAIFCVDSFLQGITKFVEIVPKRAQHAFVMYVYLRDAPQRWPASSGLRK